MKHPQPGVGCGPCSWSVPGVLATIGNTTQAAQTLLVHATTALMNTEHTLVAHGQKDGRKGRGSRCSRKASNPKPGKLANHKMANIYGKLTSRNEGQDMRFGKATDQFCHSFIKNKFIDVNLQKLDREKETVIVSNSSDAIRKYYAAFPPLHKDNSSVQQYIMPAPSWCRKPLVSSENKVAETEGINPSKEWLRTKNRKSNNQKTRRNSYHDQTKRKNSSSKRRCHSFSKSFENEALPEWVTHEGVWDMETQDPVKEFIRALAMDEGYGTCENTMTDDAISFRFNALECSSIERSITIDSNYFKNETVISPVKPLTEEEESLAKFKAKFDRSLEALWSRDQANTPDDECQELPVDFQELLSSPYNEANSKFVILQNTERSIWSSPSDRGEDYFNARAADIWSYDGTAKNKNCDDKAISKECMEIISDKFKPLNIRDDESPPARVYPSMASSSLIWEPLKCDKIESNLWSDEDTDCEPSSLYRYKEVYDSMPTVTNVMRSLTTLNHNKQLSSFTEVIPKWPTGYIGDGRPGKFSSHYAESKYKEQISTIDQKEEEDLLNSGKTHFQPIKQESGDCSNSNAVDYVDGMTFSIVSDLEEVKFNRSQSGTMYLESESEPPKQYMEYRAKLTDKINFKNNNSKIFCDESENEFVLKFQVRQIEKAIQTDNLELDSEQTDATPAKKLLLSNRTADERMEFPHISANEMLKNMNQINANVDEAELVRIQNEKSTKDLWKVCEDCKSEDIWKFNGKMELLQTDENISKIWSSNDNVCRACNAEFTIEPQSSQSPKEKFTKDDLREWDELLSDISYMHCLRIDKVSNEEEAVGGEDCCISSSEVSVSAPDGNFIKSALKFIEIPEFSTSESGFVECAERNSVDEDSSYAAKYSREKDGWRCDRKRRHSATGRGAGGKLAALRSNGVCETLGALCPLPHDAPFLSCYSADRPLTR